MNYGGRIDGACLDNDTNSNSQLKLDEKIKKANLCRNSSQPELRYFDKNYFFKSLKGF